VATEVFTKEPVDHLVHVDYIVGVDESVPLVVLDHVLDLDAAVAQRRDQVVGFGLHDTYIVGALNDQ